MAKKPTAKTKPSPKVAPAPKSSVAESTTLASRAAAPRPPAGRKNRAARTPLDATPEPESTPVATASVAAVTAPPTKATGKTIKTAAPRAKKEALAAAPAPMPKLASNDLSARAEAKPQRKAKASPSTPAGEAPTETVTAPQTTANTLLNLAAKAVKLVGKKAAKLKKEVNEAAAANYAARREAAPEKEITQEEIAIRAYLISEKRQQQGIHAEPHEDWAEAERQLRAEAGQA